jgi:arsenate reductase
MKKPKIAFICVHNSCRSQIAEALGKHLASDVFESYSAGTEIKPQINQDAVLSSADRLMMIGNFLIRQAKVMKKLKRSLMRSRKKYYL